MKGIEIEGIKPHRFAQIGDGFIVFLFPNHMGHLASPVVDRLRCGAYFLSAIRRAWRNNYCSVFAEKVTLRGMAVRTTAKAKEQKMNRRRITVLERLLGTDKTGPTLEAVVSDCRRLDKWLASIGMTARDALAAGLTAPPELGLRWISLTATQLFSNLLDEYLTPRERLPLILAASTRGDEAEQNRLAHSATGEAFRHPDYHGLAEGMLPSRRLLLLYPGLMLPAAV